MRTRFSLAIPMMVGLTALATSGCFATRMVRTDTVTSYDLVRADATAQRVGQDATVLSAVPRAPATARPEGTLVVEALVTPTVPAPVRLPDIVAALTVAAVPAPPAPTWDPLPSYVGQFTGPGWQHRPLFGGGTSPSTTFRAGWRAPGPILYGYGTMTTGTGSTGTGTSAYSSSHFSSAPSFSGSTSSHFSGGSAISGY